MSPNDEHEGRGRARIGRRSYLALAAAVSVAGCSMLGGDGEPTDERREPTDDGESTATATEAAQTVTATPHTGTDAVGAAAAGDVVAVAADRDYVRISTADSATPVQDGFDLVAEQGGGHVYLPPGTTRNEGALRPHRNTGLYGFGTNVSALRITGAGSDGIRFDRDRRAHWVELDGFELRGPGADSPTGVAIHYVDNGTEPVSDPSDLRVGHLYCRQWHDSVYRVDEGVGPFQCRLEYLRADDCDAGDARALVDWRSTYGPANWFGTIVSYPNDSVSGQNTDVLSQRGGELTVGDISVGGTAGRMVDKRAGRLRVGRLHYEPEAQPSVPDSLVRVAGVGQTHVDDVIVDAGRVETVYELGDGAGDAVLYRPTADRGEVTGPIVRVTGRLHPQRRSWYFGSADEVTVETSTRTGSLRVMDEAGRGLG
ncbi:hypothetical protein [Halosimplex litoreum]|uniref:hypothetical protein n=1 Tax=Halosimplex litoreum TaxID=1198301 RepID=UPI001E61AB3B|nr:hypothetical protein [Halosimplex litoreum]